ncbi:hypothetical protein [Pseudooctadecabacter jejudonensis]|uniref:Uncharacterized protein n=1 Tax=Pseudooctadecabacter jejudonensis TaxID=1391910 RepID=A0A1Y5T5T4_9RHOB|nr:hypothetical protein [Pseudooctadecabacter jejudonensis]SLN54650.1 hypothetical protein PSJ8397_02857 [Pseudooctadecabacter jejudonensis]
MADDNTPDEMPPKAPPYATNTLVKDGDIRILAWVGGGAMGVLVLFGLVLGQTGLIDFPHLNRSEDLGEYYVDTLIYRERRVALALVMRTFITGFSFVVGLALCTMGGLFILRQVTSLTTISGSMGGGPNALSALSDGEDAAKTLKESQFAFSSYSPGVLFMLGGVLVMGITQALAIPIKSIEVVPPGATAWCLTEEGGTYEICRADVETEDAVSPPTTPDRATPQPPAFEPVATGEEE